MSNFKRDAPRIQKAFEAVLIEETEDEYDHDDADFVFRYSNGGTLPIIRRGSKDYHCLFYRDVEPVGWNIANGASDTLVELLNPSITIERELCEELIIFDIDHEIDHVFSWGADATIERPEFQVVQTLWTPFLSGKDISRFEKQAIPVLWEFGPDVLRIQLGTSPPAMFSVCYININAWDFGIEADRVAYMSVSENAVLLDVEINDNRILNRPVGLFDVERLKSAVENGETAFFPDILFYGVAKQVPGKLKWLIQEEFFPRLITYGIREKAALNTWVKEDNPFGLCPVTRQIITRHRDKERPPTTVFTSYARDDEEFANSWSET